jgi:hypothetical protein
MSRHLSWLLVAQTFVVLSMFSSAAVSGESPLGSKLISSMLFEQQLAASRDECQSTARDLDVSAIQARNPALFLGIAPHSSVWPEVKAAYLQYVQKVCVPMSMSQYLNRAEQVYSQHLTNEELQAAIDFFQSPVGQKFAAASAKAALEVNQIMSIEAVNVQKSAWKEYEDRLLQLHERAKGTR